MTDLLTTLNHLETYKAEYMDETIDDPSQMIEFVACGEEDDFDADVNYPLSTQVTDSMKPYQYYEPA